MESNPSKLAYNQSVTHPVVPQWKISERAGTGMFVTSVRDTLLFRIDRASGIIYCWDKKTQTEIPVDVTLLFPGKIGV